MTATTAIRQLTSSEDMTRMGREVDDDRGEITTDSLVNGRKLETGRVAVRGHTNDTIDRNRAMGRAHSRTSACVSAQHAPPGRLVPTTWT